MDDSGFLDEQQGTAPPPPAGAGLADGPGRADSLGMALDGKGGGCGDTEVVPMATAMEAEAVPSSGGIAGGGVDTQRSPVASVPPLGADAADGSKEGRGEAGGVAIALGGDAAGRPERIRGLAQKYLALVTDSEDFFGRIVPEQQDKTDASLRALRTNAEHLLEACTKSSQDFLALLDRATAAVRELQHIGAGSFKAAGESPAHALP